ncbi:hypothetical protein [Thiolapillus sp.]|uniref:hypothetical protein n=3 Tax=Thiolapillus sp. TaxID=2017437 RepID=UPI003AF7F1FF
MKNPKKILAWALPVTALLSAPAAIMAETFTGKLNGHGCAHAGTTCPVDRLDPHIALESDFVLQKGSGDYYFLPNLPNLPYGVKVRHVLEDVQVDGTLDKRYNQIDVNAFRVKKAGSYKTMWSKAMQKKEQDALEDGGVPFFLP